MTTKRRWMQTALAMSATDSFEMPWSRGARRAAFIAYRTAPALRAIA